MKKTYIFILIILFTGFAQAGTWVPTGTLPGNCAIFTMTGTISGDVIIADYNSTLHKKMAGSNTWVPCGLAGRKIRFLTTAPNGDIYAISGTGAYVIDAYTAIHRSTDNGNSWEQLFSRATPYSNSIGGSMLFLPDNSILAAFPYQKGPTIGDFITTMMCKSTNGGNSWFMTDSVQLGWPAGMIQINENKVFLGTTYDGIYTAPITGRNWWPVDTTAHFFGTRYTTNLTKTKTGKIFAGLSRKVVRSDDNGQTFLSFATPSPSASINALCAISDREVYIATDDRKIYLSTDMGETWQTAIAGLPANTLVNSLGVIDGKLFAGSYANGVYFLNTDVVSVPNNNSIVKGFELKQNYPNPFNPSTKISFSIAKASFVKLSVYDTRGREVRNIINENRLAGNYEFNFDASELSGGVYYYKIQADGLAETKKMILIK